MDVADMPAAVREAARVLAPGGRLCACVTHPLHRRRLAGDDDGAFVVDRELPRERWFRRTMERKGLSVHVRRAGAPARGLRAGARGRRAAHRGDARARRPGGRALGARADVPHVARGQGALGARAAPGWRSARARGRRGGRAARRSARAAQVQVGPDEELDRAGGAEAVDEVLGQRAIDLGRAPRRERRAVAARVHDVGVEAVLVRAVAEPAVAGPERSRPADG